MNDQLIKELAQAIIAADAILIGAGAGLSAAAGADYSGPEFEKNFGDFIEKYHFPDLYTGGFGPFESLEEFWAYWSRHVFLHRYNWEPDETHKRLLDIVRGRNYFVLTTNVDHRFQMAGFDKDRLFYVQGDFGLFQCSVPCHLETYDNEETIRAMYEQQKDMRVPTELLPVCPRCGQPMTENLRVDNTFVEDEGWRAAAKRYEDFLKKYSMTKILFLELGVGENTPGIIKYPMWQMTARNPQATFAAINQETPAIPERIAAQSIIIAGDIADAIGRLAEDLGDVGRDQS